LDEEKVLGTLRCSKRSSALFRGPHDLLHELPNTIGEQTFPIPLSDPKGLSGIASSMIGSFERNQPTQLVAILYRRSHHSHLQKLVYATIAMQARRKFLLKKRQTPRHP
jgi:hypothetical protein